MKKTVKILTMGMLFIGMTVLVGCKKEDMSQYATKSDLNNYVTHNELSESGFKAKEYNFLITFTPSQTWGSSPTIYKDNPDDVIIVYTKWDDLGGTPTWAQCPVTFGNLIIVPEFTNYTLFVNLLKADGTAGSPLSQNLTLPFRAVVIPVSGITQNPDVNYNNYEEVAKTFNLE